MRFVMGMMKEKLIEEEIGVDEVKEGLRWLSMWGKKSFKDYTGEWVEVRCSGQMNLFSDEIEIIPHVVEGV
tara:strand:- start:558 stop:770 length:213 start_codon:yes stop_codon:yes gene_type:complete